MKEYSKILSTAYMTILDLGPSSAGINRLKVLFDMIHQNLNPVRRLSPYGSSKFGLRNQIAVYICSSRHFPDPGSCAKGL